jgi:hypothetical protein
MLEHGVSQQTLPKDARIGRLVAFMEEYGTAKIDGERITSYLKKLDEAMKHFNVSPSHLLVKPSNSSPSDVSWAPHCHRSEPDCHPC